MEDIRQKYPGSYLLSGSSQFKYLSLNCFSRDSVCAPIGFDKSRKVFSFVKSNSYEKDKKE